MIISHLYGGLGNQMFQYAVARAQSLEKGVEMALDISAFSKEKIHQGFELERAFGCPFCIAKNEEIYAGFGSKAVFHLQRLTSRLPIGLTDKMRTGMQFIREPYFEYWAGIKSIPNDSYLRGYWQSERYFGCYASQIRTDFTFKPATDPDNLMMAERIRSSSCPISIHIRRGDMANNPKSNAYHGNCSPMYYKHALSFLRQQGLDPQLFIFSDDLEWAKDQLSFEGYQTTFVQHNRGTGSYQDMALMSLCHHHVIANSSFSWWSAWLNPLQTKLVIAPKQWFMQEINTVDLIPTSWIRL